MLWDINTTNNNIVIWFNMDFIIGIMSSVSFDVWSVWPSEAQWTKNMLWYLQRKNYNNMTTICHQYDINMTTICHGINGTGFRRSLQIEKLYVFMARQNVKCYIHIYGTTILPFAPTRYSYITSITQDYDYTSGFQTSLFLEKMWFSFYKNEEIHMLFNTAVYMNFLYVIS